MLEYELSINDINTRIKKEVCYKTLKELSDLNIKNVFL